MNSNQDNKTKCWSKLDSSVIFPQTYQRVSLSLKEGDTAGAEKQVDWFAEQVAEEPKKIYGDFLCVAAQSGNITTAEFCKEKGADLNHRAYGNKTPLGSAKFSGQGDMINCLTKWGASDDTYNPYNQPSSSLDKCSYSNQEKQGKGKKDKKECMLM